MLALWQIIALWILVPLALFFAGRCLLILACKWIGPNNVMQMLQPGPSQAWIKQQQQAYRSYNNKPAVKPPVTLSISARKSPYYQEFLKKRDYS